jgi:hypothetical protein
MSEPLWRKILCWGAMTSFFLLPFVAFIVVVYSVTLGAGLTDTEVQNFKAFSSYQTTLAALVFGLAGLNSWDKKIANGQTDNKQTENAHN